MRPPIACSLTTTGLELCGHEYGTVMTVAPVIQQHTISVFVTLLFCNYTLGCYVTLNERSVLLVLFHG